MEDDLLQILKQDGAKIIYCSTKVILDKVCDFLSEQLIEYCTYFAGLNESYKKQNSEKFLFGRTNLIVATSAFGLGINKPNVRCVILYGCSPDIETYYQEMVNILILFL